MNKFKKGDKVRIIQTGRKGKIVDIMRNDDYSSFGASIMNYEVHLDGFLLPYRYTLNDIEKIGDVLDEVEKRYLKRVIKPLNITSIAKFPGSEKDYSCLVLSYYHKKEKLNVVLPPFKNNRNMYEGMEEFKEYTLEELDLI